MEQVTTARYPALLQCPPGSGSITVSLSIKEDCCNESMCHVAWQTAGQSERGAAARVANGAMMGDAEANKQYCTTP